MTHIKPTRRYTYEVHLITNPPSDEPFMCQAVGSLDAFYQWWDTHHKNMIIPTTLRYTYHNRGVHVYQTDKLLAHVFRKRKHPRPVEIP